MNEKDLETADMPEPTKTRSGTIKAIANDTVHKICSGQVVLSLAVAVKELVENAIDAGATLVEIKLHNQGLDSLEVSDNGSGVEECSLEAMTAKYHTSKIREFVDLEGVETFGFRGEALSSLCALADMTIVTRHTTTDVGLKVELDHEGCIKSRRACARTVGTSVILANLFVTLPVRRRDFTRNIKKEFNKMCQLLQAYCLVAKKVRIICTNHNAKGAKTLVMQTNGAPDVCANIASIFGQRQMSDIVPIKAAFDDVDSFKNVDGVDESLDSAQITPEDVERLKAGQFQLEGFISSCSHGAGRSSKDRQYFYINDRPCEPKNIAKLINDIYRRYNVHQYPFIYLNVITARADVDVNLTPDKRQLLINNEKLLLHFIKKSLLNTFGNIPSTFKMQNCSVLNMLKKEVQSEDVQTTNLENTSVQEREEEDDIPMTSTQKYANVLSQWKYTGDTIGTAPPAAKRKCEDEPITTQTWKLKKIQEYLTKEDHQTDESLEAKANQDSQCNENISDDKSNLSVLDMNTLKKESSEYDTLTQKPISESFISQRIDCKVLTPAKPKLYIKAKELQKSNSNEYEITLPTLSLSQTSNACSVQLDEGYSDDEDNLNTDNACAEMNISLSELALNMRAEENVRNDIRRKANLERLRFKSTINPSQNQNAEAELQKEIAKEAFAEMQILGQFNLGFIVVKLDDDLFIVDQHATDEKYNFEMLQRTTVLQHQRLAVPQTLEMTAVNEMVLLDHLEMFEKNGFKFEVDENAPTTRKVRLLGKPFSKNWEFGKADIDELIFMLQDAPVGDGTVCRPSRIRAMFASRACRQSVMIGKALKKSNMETLIRHMGEIEQPWNCPHGRPTMRHLINIAMLLDVHDENNDMVM